MGIIREDNENYFSYIKRLTENRKEYDLDYAEWCKLLTGKEYSSDNSRKAFYVIQPLIENIEKEGFSDEDILKENEKQKIELIKEKVKLRDQRRELNKLITEEARWENLIDIIIEKINTINNNYPLVVNPNYDYDVNCKKEGLLLLSDWHYGIEIKNILNEYNPKIAKERINKLKNKTIEYCKLHNIGKLNIILQGDLLSGIIHTTLRIQNVENIVSQITNLSEILSQLFIAINNEIPELNIYTIPGNHGRINPNKKESINSENFELLLPLYLETRLSNIENIKIIKSKYEDIVHVNIFGKDILGVHGDKDSLKNVARNLTKVTNIVPYMVCYAHLHRDARDEDGTFVVVNGSMSGIDEYALDNRYVSKPHQKLIIFEEGEGEICTYKISF